MRPEGDSTLPHPSTAGLESREAYEQYSGQTDPFGNPSPDSADATQPSHGA